MVNALRGMSSVRYQNRITCINMLGGQNEEFLSGKLCDVYSEHGA